MKASGLKSTTEKVVNIMIVVMIVAGTAAFALINQVSSGSELMPKLFLAFFGAIITVQLIPGLVLIGAMIKGVMGIGNKEKTPLEAHVNSDTQK